MSRVKARLRNYVDYRWDDNWETMIPVIMSPDGTEIASFTPYAESIAIEDCKAMNADAAKERRKARLKEQKTV